MSDDIQIPVSVSGGASVRSLISNLDEIHEKLAALGGGRVGSALGNLKSEVRSLSETFANINSTGASSLNELRYYKDRLDSALTSIRQVIDKNKRMTPSTGLTLGLDSDVIRIESANVVTELKASAVALERAIREKARKEALAIEQAAAQAARATARATEIELAAARVHDMSIIEQQTGAHYSPYNANTIVSKLENLSEVKPQNYQASLDKQLLADRRFNDARVAFEAKTQKEMDVLREKAQAKHISSLNTVITYAHQRDAERVALEAKTQKELTILRERAAIAQAKLQLTGAIPVGAYSSIANADFGKVYSANSVLTVSNSFRKLGIDMNYAHSAARGLASGFNAMWLTWGNIAPILAGAAISYSFSQAIKKGTEFQQTMYGISELAGVSAESMGALSDSILKIGTSTQYGPLEAAKAVKVLTLAGLDAASALKALRPTLDFAAAGETTVDKAAATLVAVGTAYSYTATQFSLVSDLISKTAADTMASVDTMSESFKTASVVAQMYGVSLSSTSQALGALAQIGITGTVAGTAVRNFYTAITKNNGAAVDALKALKIQLYDTAAEGGQIKSMLEISAQAAIGLVSKTQEASQKFFKALSNERGGKVLAAEIALLHAEVLKLFPDFKATEQAFISQGNKAELSAYKIKTLTAAYEALKDKQDSAIVNAAGFAFFASVEAQLTSLGTYKGVLASLESDFIKAFNKSSDAVFVLGVELRKSLNSPEVLSAITKVVGGIVTFLEWIVKGTIWMTEHSTATLALVAGYVSLYSAVGIIARVMLDTTFIIKGATTAMTLLNVALAVGPGKLLLIIGTLGLLAYELIRGANSWDVWSSAKDKALNKERAAERESVDGAIKATRTKIDLTAQRLADEKASLTTELNLKAQGASQAEIADKVMGEMALHRIREIYDQHAALIKLQNLEEIGFRKRQMYIALADSGSSQEFTTFAIKSVETQASAELAGKLSANEVEYNKELNKTKQLVADVILLKRSIAALDEESAKEAKSKLGATDTAGLPKQTAVQRASDALKGDIARLLEANKLLDKTAAGLKEATAAKIADLVDKEIADVAAMTIAYTNLEQQRVVSIQKTQIASDLGNTSEAEAIVNIAAAQDNAYSLKKQELTEIHKLKQQNFDKELNLLEEERQQELAIARIKIANLYIVAQKTEDLAKVKSKDPEANKASATATGELNAAIAAYENLANSTKYLQGIRKKASEENASFAERESANSAKYVEGINNQILAVTKELKTTSDRSKYRAMTAREIQLESVLLAENAASIAEERFQNELSIGEDGDKIASYRHISESLSLIAKSKREVLSVDMDIESDWVSAGIKSAKEYTQTISDIAKDIGSLTSKLFKGMEDSLTSWLSTGKAGFRDFANSVIADITRIFVKQQIMRPLMTGLGLGGVSLGAGAASAVGGSIGSSMAGGAVGSGLFGGGLAATGFGQAMGATMSNGMISGFGVNMANISALAEGGSYVTALGAAMPYVAAALVALKVFSSLDNSGTPHTGGFGEYSAVGGLKVGAASSLAGTAWDNPYSKALNTSSGNLAIGTVGMLDATATAFGKTAGYAMATGFADDSSKDGAWGALKISRAGSKVLDWQDTRTSNWAPKVFADGQTGMEEYTAAVAKSVKDAIDQIGLPDWAKTMLNNIGDAPSMEEVTSTVQRINELQNTFKSFGDAAAQMPFANLRDLSFETTMGLIAAAGGMDKLGVSLNTYYDKFYSAQEKTDNLTHNTTAAFAAIGIVMPKVNDSIRAWYRSEVERLGAMDLGVQANAQAYTSALSLAGAVDMLAVSLSTLKSDVLAAADKVTSVLRSIGNDVKAFADAATSAQDNLLTARSNISDALWAAQDRVTELQQQAAEGLRTFTSSLDDFLATINPATGSTASLASLKAQLSATAVLASGSDTGAQGKLIAQAQAVLKAASASSTSAIDYARSEAFVRSTVASVKTSVTPVVNAAAIAIVDPLTAATSAVRAYALLAQQTGAATDRTTRIAADSITGLAASFSAAQIANINAQNNYNEALRVTQGLTLTVNGSFDGLITDLASLDAANATLRDSVAALTTSLGLPNMPAQDLATYLGLAGQAAQNFITLINSMGTATQVVVPPAVAGQYSTPQVASYIQDNNIGGNTGELAKVASVFGVSAAQMAAAQSLLASGDTSSVTAAHNAYVASATPAQVTQNLLDTTAAGLVQQIQGTGGTAAGAKSYSMAELQSVLASQAALGYTADQLIGAAASGYGVPEAAIRAAGQSLHLPGYATGTNYLQSDGLLYGHKGEEIKSAPYVDLERNSRDETNALLRRLVASNAELKAEVTALKKSNEATQKATEKTADTINVVTRGGRAMQTETFV